MRQKTTTYYWTFVILILAGSVFSSPGYSTPRDFSDILKSKVLKICYTPWRGVDTEPDMPSPHMEIARVFAKSLNLKPVIKSILWEEQFRDSNGKINMGQVYTPALFDNGDCDLFANNLGRKPWRDNLMNFNWVYNERHVVVVLKKNKDFYQNADDLSNRKTVVVPNTTYHDWLLLYNNTHEKKIEIATASAGGTLKYLLNGEVDFIILSSAIVIYSKFHLNKEKEIEISFPISQPNASGWGFPKESYDLLRRSKEFIKDQSGREDSETNFIFKKYFGLSLKEFHELQEKTIL